MNNCWLFKGAPPAFILLGRYGDVIQVLPCLLAIYQRTAMKPVLIISDEYASVLEGVSYVTPHPIHAHWWKGIVQARQIARTLYGNAVVPQWWYDDTNHARMVTESSKGDFVIQCHGIEWGVDMSKHPDYGTSMASRLGFTQEEWVNLPLVFDKRVKVREETFARKVIGADPRPVILYNFSGNSSPFGGAPEVLNGVRNTFGRIFRFLDLGSIHAFRIFDLLGFYDYPKTVGLLTSDTSTLHLAPASGIPYIGFTVNSWSSSVPKGNCVLHVKYNDVRARTKEIVDQVGRWKPV